MKRKGKRISVDAQRACAVILVLFGGALIFAAFAVPPTGVIDPTVLAAFGEILTFSGALFGIDAKYRTSPSPFEGGE